MGLNYGAGNASRDFLVEYIFSIAALLASHLLLCDKTILSAVDCFGNFYDSGDFNHLYYLVQALFREMTTRWRHTHTLGEHRCRGAL